MLHGGWRFDPDHKNRRVSGLPPAPGRFPAAGEPFPDGIGDARSNGGGGVLLQEPASGNAAERLRAALARPRGTGMPAFTATGDLPAGIHDVTWGELQARLAPPGNERRAALTAQLRTALDAFAAAGIEQVLVGGSYASAKAHPGDIDLAWIPRSDGARPDVGAARSAIRAHAPDVHPQDAAMLVTDAPIVTGAVPGESHAELLQHTRDGAARGVLLLTTADSVAPALHRIPAIVR